ncbi:MAG: nuclease [Methylophilaceae bacterium 17-43-7]|nr:MAG: nuclease [Methylophilaceae bacterium 17-43-7]
MIWKCLVLTLFLIQSAYADVLSGRVVGVADGDTITVLDSTNTQHKIRLGGIDAPEKKQAYGNVSKKSLSDMVFNQQVDVEWHKKDRYGRKVGKVLLKDEDINIEQIKLGMAWFYKKYKGELVQEDRIYYEEAQQEAEANQVGLWVDAYPIPPWEFRKQPKVQRTD